MNLTIDPKEVTTTITDFIQTYVHNAGREDVVIGLSGGIDSAVSAALCKQALGKDHVHCIFLPEESTPEQDIKHIELLTKKVDLHVEEIDITSLVRQVESECPKNPDKLEKANIKARVRMVVLYQIAYRRRCLVCGASNKSELLLGYFTKYGDGGVDIQPIGDLYKTQVYQLARYLKIPVPVISKPPTAGLWRGQTDEQELGMSYQTLDKILMGLEQKLSIDRIASLTSTSLPEVKRIKEMRVKSQHKRRLPLIPKVGMRTAGLDWRSPVQEK